MLVEKQYIFKEDDLNYVQNLLGDEVEVFLKDDNTIMDTRYNIRNKYIRSGYINFTDEFYDEIRNHFSKIGKVTFNNTGSTWWIFY